MQERRSHALPAPLALPNPGRVFVFFHLRKTGGSALSNAIAASAASHGLHSYMLCKRTHGTLVHCLAHDFTPLLGERQSYDVTVYAGEFYWQSLGALGRTLARRFFAWGDNQRDKNHGPMLYKSSPNPGLPMRYTDLTPPFACLVMVREPVDRWCSCYEERLRPRLHRRDFTSLTPWELEEVAANHTDGLYGCNNEIARFIGPSSGWGDKRTNDGALTREEVLETERRLSQCVIGNVVGRPQETLRVVRHWFPWLNYSAQNDGHRRKTNASVPRASPSYDAAIDIIRRYNALDLYLYGKAMQIFEAQVALLEAEGSA